MTVDEAKAQIVDFIENDDFEELSDKPRVIIVSKEYRPEVTASVLWLRKFGIEITCIKLTFHELDNDTIVFESNILIPLPEAKDYIIQSEKKDKDVNTTSLSQEEYLNFYKELVSKLQSIIPNHCPDPAPKYYYQIPAGVDRVHYEWIFRGRPRSSFGVELHFETGGKEFNKTAIAKI